MSTTPATPGPYSGTSLPATTPAIKNMKIVGGTHVHIPYGMEASVTVTPKTEPWTLPAPPAGFRWHREDWTADMLPEGWRPLLDGEVIEEGDQFIYKGLWESYNIRTSSSVWIGGPCLPHYTHQRTRRPLPAPSAEPPKAKGIPLSEAFGLPPGSFSKTLKEQQEAERLEGQQAKPDDCPAWIPHDGKGCPLKDEEVEEWEMKFRDGTCSISRHRPSVYDWDHDKVWHDITHYRVTKWKPGHSLQPATFEHNGDIYNRHTPGDPRPVHQEDRVFVAFKDGTYSSYADLAENWDWTTELPEDEWIIGWRYADEPAQAPAAPTEAEEAKKKLTEAEQTIRECDEIMRGWSKASDGPLADNVSNMLLYMTELEAQLAKLQACQPPAHPTESPQDWTPRPGDVVRLKSGGPEMTVSMYDPQGLVETVWISADGRLHEAAFRAASLQPSKEEARP